ncbi:SUMF1/EgtB/PvdO family nonheme iron enzyme [Catellatospora sp. NPDC049133]|uniref:NACHT domain-containing protein n=1 Tax=Catellatospora sp. NPDC049133 TaxID=3155499 RepID=UPI0033E45C26
MIQLFVSYSRDDGQEFVQWLVDYLHGLPGEKINVSYDLALSPAAKEGWSRQLEELIDSAHFVVLILTKGAVESAFVAKEILYAQDHDKIIFPVLIEPCDIPLTIIDLQYVDFTGERETASRELVQHLRKGQPPPRDLGQMPATTRAVYRSYLRSLIHRLSALPLSAIDQMAEDELDLPRLWTPLDTTARSSPTSTEQMFKLPGKTISVTDMIATEQQLVLMGDPGAGKSTAARYVALCLASAELDPTLNGGLGLIGLGSGWTHGPMTPIYVDLREFAARGEQSDEFAGLQLLKYMLKAIEINYGELVPEFRRRLFLGKCFVVLDGMDEVPQAKRRRLDVLASIRSFSQEFADCRILVTTRTYAFRSQDWKLSGFAEAEIAPFETRQIDAYIDRWYTALARRRPELGGRQVSLKRAIAQRQDLGYLAQRPLLLSLMASIHSHGSGMLPHRRAALYREITNLLLVHWEGLKNVLNPQTGETQSSPSSLAAFIGHGIKPEDLHAALCQVAYEAHMSMDAGRDSADITFKHLAFVLNRALMPDPTDDVAFNPFSLAQELRDRSGILVAHDEDVYRFPHRTFQEYMAACHLCLDPLFPEQLVVHAREDPDRWREVLILAAGESVPGPGRYRQLYDLLDELIPVDLPLDGLTDPQNIEWTMALFAGLCLTGCGVDQAPERGRSHVVHNRILGWLKNLIETGALTPLNRLEAGQVLGVLGDTREGIGVSALGIPDIRWSDPIDGGYISLGRTTQRTRSRIGRFQLSKFPVTNAQYHSFVEDLDGWSNPDWWAFSPEAMAWRMRPGSTPPVRSEPADQACPRCEVTWYEAVAFCRWLSAKTGLPGIRLPTEAEWEFASRGRRMTLYPWGDEHLSDRANIKLVGDEAANSLDRVCPVGMFPLGRGVHGVEDAVGNVWEWCQTTYASKRTDDNTDDLLGQRPRVVKGGSWRTTVERSNLTERGRLAPYDASDEIGFRVCLPLGDSRS